MTPKERLDKILGELGEDTVDNMSALVLMAYFSVVKLGARKMCVCADSREEADELRKAFSAGDECSGFRFFKSFRETRRDGTLCFDVELSRLAADFLQSDDVRKMVNECGAENIWRAAEASGGVQVCRCSDSAGDEEENLADWGLVSDDNATFGDEGGEWRCRYFEDEDYDEEEE